MSSYDENLLDNPFFRAVLQQKEVIDVLINENITICVPCMGSTGKVTFSKDDIETHAIIKDEVSQKLFRTLNNKVLNQVNKGFKTADNFEDERVVRILFEETYFLDEHKHFQVICIEAPFAGKALEAEVVANVETLQQCTTFLFDENTAWARSELDKVLQHCVVSHKSAGMCLKQLITNTKTTYQKCMDLVQKSFHWPRKVLLSQQFPRQVALSVECYVHNYLHRTIFSELCYIFGAKDAALNKVCRNLAFVKPSDIDDVNPAFFSSLPTAREKMRQLNTAQSPREKIQLLSDCLSCLPTALDTGVAMSMDDLLPLLNYLIIKSEVPNWLANICYMQHFMFAQYSTDDRHEFTLVCYEASLEHIRKGSLNYLISPANQSDLAPVSLYDPDIPLSDVFRNCVELNRVEDVVLMLGSVTTPHTRTISTSKMLHSAMRDPLSEESIEDSDSLEEIPALPNGVSTQIIPGDLYMAIGRSSSNPLHPESLASPDKEKKCHPLCSCDACEQEALELRWRDVTVELIFEGSGVTALHIAAQNNYTAMIEVLVERGANVNAVDSAGRTPLHLACQRGAMLALLLLLHHKANANACDHQNRTPLHELCERGHTDCLQALVYQKVSLRVNFEAENGDTPLHLAARYGYADMVSILLDVGASMSLRNLRGDTPLSTAQNKYIGHILQLFSSELELEQVKAGAPDNTINEEQEKLFRLCAEGDIQMIKHKLNIKNKTARPSFRPRLRSAKKRCHPLCQCEECDSNVEPASISRTLLCNSDQYTLLHIAALYGHSDLALLFSVHFVWMLDAVTFRHKLSPLHLACQYNSESIVDILITAGAEVDCVDSQGNTPLHFSCTNGHTGCAFLLLEGGVDTAIQNNRGDSPLHQAARWGHIPLVNLMLRYNASWNVTNKDGMLPVHLSQYSEVLEALNRAMGADTEDDASVYTDCVSESSGSPGIDRREDNQATADDSLEQGVSALSIEGHCTLYGEDALVGSHNSSIEVGVDATCNKLRSDTLTEADTLEDTLETPRKALEDSRRLSQGWVLESLDQSLEHPLG